MGGLGSQTTEGETAVVFRCLLFSSNFCYSHQMGAIYMSTVELGDFAQW